MKKINELELAIAEAKFDDIDLILLTVPNILSIKNLENYTLFYNAGLLGKTEVLDFILNHKVFKAYSIQNQCEFLRDAVDGSIELALKYYQEGKQEQVVAILEKIVVYYKKILEKNNDDYTRLHYILYLKARIFMTNKQWQLAYQALSESIFIAGKITDKNDQDYSIMIFCLNAIAKFYVLENNLNAAIDHLKKAYRVCQKISIDEKNKSNMLLVLEKNLAILCYNALNHQARRWGYECIANNLKQRDSLKTVFLENVFPENQFPNRQAIFEDIQALLSEHLQYYGAYYNNLKYKKEFLGTLALKEAEEAFILSRVFRINLVIFSSQGAPLIIKQPEPQATLCVGRQEDGGYSFLYPQENQAPIFFLEEALQRAPLDDFYDHLSKVAFEEGKSEESNLNKIKQNWEPESDEISEAKIGLRI